MPALLKSRLMWSVACSVTTASRNASTWRLVGHVARVGRDPCPRGAPPRPAASSRPCSRARRRTSPRDSPRRRAACASSRPMPVPPPVTTASFPRKVFMPAGNSRALASLSSRAPRSWSSSVLRRSAWKRTGGATGGVSAGMAGSCILRRPRMSSRSSHVRSFGGTLGMTW